MILFPKTLPLPDGWAKLQGMDEEWFQRVWNRFIGGDAPLILVRK